MKSRVVAVAATVVAVVVCPSFVFAQKGMGDPIGVARQSVKPEVTSLSGELTAVETHPCEKTTGHALAGTHILLKNSNGETLNVHLGPAEADVVKGIVKQLVVGKDISAAAFRTDKMPKLNFVAVSLTFDDKTVVLRDEGLRPVWAGEGPRGWQQRGMRGRGHGRGWGRGW